MTQDSDTHERSLAFGEQAIEQVKTHRVAASPRIYELWYSYVAGEHPALNRAIERLVQARTGVTTQGLEEIYDSHISPQRFTTRVDRVNSRLQNEMDTLADLVESMAQQASTYTGDLRRAATELSSDDAPEEYKSALSGLLALTSEMANVNQKLETLLHDSHSEIGILQQALHTVMAESLTDPLTGLYNRKAFDSALTSAINKMHASGRPTALLVADVDHFKRFNDKWGHQTGDQVLKLVAQSIKQSIGSNDLAARYGGEEFTVILPGRTLQEARTIAEQIRTAVMTRELVKRSTGENLGRATLSIGIALLRPLDSAIVLFERADGCLYAAKKAGRNRVICEGDPAVPAAASRRAAAT